jgi:hypothetical protein
MPPHLPIEIQTQIFKDVLNSLLGNGLDYEDDGKPKWDRSSNAYRARYLGRRKVFEMRLVSKIARDVIDPMVFREIKEPSDRAVEVLCEMMVQRPELAKKVEVFEFEESEESASEEEESEEEEDEDDDSDYDSDPDSEVQRERALPPAKKPKPLVVAAEDLSRKFHADATGTYARALEETNLTWLATLNRKSRPWILLFQLANLSSLTLTVRTDTFANFALFLRLPRLERLEFSVLATGPNVGSQENYAPPEEMLEAIISSTDRLRHLEFEDGSGDVFSPVRHNVTKVKRVLERAGCAERLEYLSVIFSNNHERDWREEQEFSYMTGYFGSLRHFTKLSGLAMQIDALLGKPGENPHLMLRDVLPEQLDHFTGISMQDYSQPDEAETLWDEPHLIPQLRDLALAARESDESAAVGDGGGKRLRFPELTSVKMHRHRKDHFYTDREAQMKGSYADDDPTGILADSRIYFGWVRGPYANTGPGPD